MHDRLAGAARAHDRGGDLDALVLLPHRLGPRQRPARALELLVGDAGVERQRHRHLEHPQRLDHGAALAEVLVLLGREPARRLDDVVVEREPADRHEDRAVLGLLARPRERLLGHGDALEDRLVLGDPVVDVQRHAEGHPADAHPARAAVVEEQRAERGQRQHAPPARRAAAARRGPIRTLSGILYGRSRSGSRQRRRITPIATIANAIVAPNAQMPTRKSRSAGSSSAIASTVPIADHDHGRRAARVQVADQRRDLAVDRERVAEAREPEHRRVAGGEQDQHARDRQRVAQRLADPRLRRTRRRRRPSAPRPSRVPGCVGSAAEATSAIPT